MNTNASNQSITVRPEDIKASSSVNIHEDRAAKPAPAGVQDEVPPADNLPGLYHLPADGWPLSLHEIRYRIRIAQS